MIKDVEDLEDELCEFCPYTDFGAYNANTGPYNICEGCKCDVTYGYYLDDYYENQQMEMSKIMKEKKLYSTVKQQSYFGKMVQELLLNAMKKTHLIKIKAF